MHPRIVYLAIDPGRSGGFAQRHKNDVNTIVYPMPETESEVGDLVREIVRAASTEGKWVEAVVERVGGFAGQRHPGAAMFNFGRGVGVLVGLLIALQVAVYEVTPQSWQRKVGAGTRGSRSPREWKRHLLDLARKRHPYVRGITLKTCDALLLLDSVTTTFPHLEVPVGFPDNQQTERTTSEDPIAHRQQQG